MAALFNSKNIDLPAWAKLEKRPGNRTSETWIAIDLNVLMPAALQKTGMPEVQECIDLIRVLATRWLKNKLFRWDKDKRESKDFLPVHIIGSKTWKLAKFQDLKSYVSMQPTNELQKNFKLTGDNKFDLYNELVNKFGNKQEMYRIMFDEPHV